MTPSSPRHSLLGLGGAGCNFVQRSLDKPGGWFEWLALDSDPKPLRSNRAPRRILLGPKVAPDDPARKEPDFGRRLVQAEEGDLSSLLKGSGAVFLAAGMGGATGTGATGEIARIARKNGVPFVAALVTMPFAFEGPEKRVLALAGLETLRNTCDVVLKFGNEDLSHQAVPDQDFFGLFERFDTLMFIAARCLGDLFLRNDRLDTAQVLKPHFFGPNRLVRLGQGLASGEGRMREAWRLASKPVLAEFPTERTERLWAHVLSDDTPTPEEMETLTLRLRELKPDGQGLQVTYGRPPVSEGILRLTLLASAGAR